MMSTPVPCSNPATLVTWGRTCTCQWKGPWWLCGLVWWSCWLAWGVDLFGVGQWWLR